MSAQEQDFFLEYMVSRTETPRTWLLRILLCFIASAISTAAFLSGFSLLRLLLAALSWYIAYRLLLSTIVEYELLLTNGILDVDKIIARRKRRRLISVALHDVTAFGRYPPATASPTNCSARIFACNSPKSSDLWYCTAPTENGHALLVFSANQALLDGVKRYLPQTILHKEADNTDESGNL